MRRYLKYLIVAAATLLFVVISPLLPVASQHSPVGVETQKDQATEVEKLFQKGIEQFQGGQLREALATYQQVLAIHKELNDLAGEAEVLTRLGEVYPELSQNTQALKVLQQALTIYQELGNRRGVGVGLDNMGEVYQIQGDYPQALEILQQALVIRREVGDHIGEGETQNNMGAVYSLQGEYPKALAALEEALAIHREVGNQFNEAKTLVWMGITYLSVGESEDASEFIEQALAVSQQMSYRLLEGVGFFLRGVLSKSQGELSPALEDSKQALRIIQPTGSLFWEYKTLLLMGNIYRQQGDYAQALEYYQQALTITEEIGARRGIGVTLNNLGLVYNNRGEYQQALHYYQQALTVIQEVGDGAAEGITFNNLGGVYRSLGEYQQALAYYQKALAIIKQVGDRAGEGTTLNNLGAVYENRGEYQQALDYYQQALAVMQEVSNRAGEGSTLNNLGAVYDSLGKFQQALDYYQQALAVMQEVGNHSGEGATLSNLGLVYDNLGEYQQALAYYQQALVIIQQVGDRVGEGTTFNNLGLVYYKLGDHQQALNYYQQALAIRQEVGDRAGIGTTLNNLGAVYDNLGKYQQALGYYQQSLAIRQEIGNRAGVGITLDNIGFLLETQNQPELAIIFYKQSVNVTQAIRDDIKALPTELQQSYTETVDHTYRSLADLLLKQNRVLEAQQVLDLLKVQELEDYLRGVQGEVEEKVENLPPEQKILEEYTQLQNQTIAFGKELTQLRQIPPAQLTPTQKQRLGELDAKQRQINRLFTEFQQRPDIVDLVKQLNQTAREQSLQLGNLRKLSNNLQQNAVLLYPLILEDRLELVLATPNSPPINRTTPVKREQLNRTIVQFRQALETPTSDTLTPARQLYDWLIKPLENDLATAQVQTIIYAPDGQLRYIPLAALYDGKQWLIERFGINNITAASIDDLNTQPQPELRLLAAAFAQGNHNVQAGRQKFSFSGLPFAGREVENLAAAIPSTTKLVDNEFSKAAILPQMDSHSVVHFATHAAFVPGSPDDSFILFGNGDYVTLGEVREEWFLTNVDLIVLSACETGVGGMGNGEEILGFGYLMQNAGARAAIASLWSVSDGGTQALMNAFYELLTTGKFTKAEALRQAQIALITGDYSAVGENRGSLIVEYVGNELSQAVRKNLNHPYYWAPFILIGNGL